MAFVCELRRNIHSMHAIGVIKPAERRKEELGRESDNDCCSASAQAAELERLRVQLMMEKEAAVAQLKEEHAL